MMDEQGAQGLTSSADDHWSEDTKILNGFRIMVCVLGILGNIVVMSVIILSKDFNKGTIHWYVFQLALADSIFLLTIPLRVVEENSGWIFSGGSCKSKNSILYINYYNSTLFLMVMALDRYFAICHSFSERFAILRTHRAKYAVTAVVWTISISLAVPVMLYSAKAGEEPRCVCEFRFPPNYYDFCKKLNFKGEMVAICARHIAENNDQGCKPRFESGIMQSSEIDYSSTFSPNLTEDSSFSTITLSSITPTIPFDSSSSVYSTIMPQVELTTESSGETIYNLSTTAAAKVQEKTVGYEPGCSYEMTENGFIAFHIFNFAVMFVIPFIVVTLCYTSIVRKVRKSRFKNFREDRPVSTAQKKEDRTKNKVTIMCMALVIVFAICWLPYNVQHMVKIRGIHQTDKFCSNILRVTSLLLFLNSAINPYIYIFGASFKTKFKNLRKCCADTAAYSHPTRETRYQLTTERDQPKTEEHRERSRREEKSTRNETNVEETSAL